MSNEQIASLIFVLGTIALLMREAARKWKQ
jgi:hypothetical protein